MEKNNKVEHWGVKAGDWVDDSEPVDFELPDNKKILEDQLLDLISNPEQVSGALKKYKLEMPEAAIRQMQDHALTNWDLLVDIIYEDIKVSLGNNLDKIDAVDLNKQSIKEKIHREFEKITLQTAASIIDDIPEKKRSKGQKEALERILEIEANWGNKEEGGEGAPAEGESRLNEVIKKTLLNELNLQYRNIRAYIDRIEKNEVPNRGFSEADAKELGEEIADLYNEKNLSKYREAVKLIINSRGDNDLASISIACREFLIDSAFKNYPQLKRISDWMEFDKFGSKPNPDINPRREKKPKNFEAVVKRFAKEARGQIEKALAYIKELDYPRRTFSAVGELEKEALARVEKAMKYKPTLEHLKAFDEMGNFTPEEMDELWGEVRNDEDYAKLNERIAQTKEKERKELEKERARKRDEILKEKIRERFKNHPEIGEQVKFLLTLEYLARGKKIRVEEASSPEEIKITPDQLGFLKYTHDFIQQYITEAPRIVTEKEGRDISLEDLKGHLVSFLEKLWRPIDEKIYEGSFRPEDVERIADYIIKGRMNEIVGEK
ncbi:MAG: hypothetical protein WC858_02925 [Parcubacteria group bacterium]|jgi:hypothetical protein